MDDKDTLLLPPSTIATASEVTPPPVLAEYEFAKIGGGLAQSNGDNQTDGGHHITTW